MANASADKLKVAALRHGEKAVVGLTAAICLLLIFKATSLETIDLTPDQVKKAAQAAEANLNTTQKDEDILKRLEESGIKDPGFEKQVDEKLGNKLQAVAFRPRGPWITPEPGAGLLRDMPELIAPTELIAYPGRGGALIFAVNDSGERVPDDSKKEDAEEDAPRRGRRKKGASAARAAARKKAKEDEAEKKAQVALKNAQKAIVGGNEDAKKEDKSEETAAKEGPFKEITQGLRWVAITGVLDNQKLRDNYLTALKRREIAYPHFKMLEVARQERQSDGSWSDWRETDIDKNERVIFNLPEEEEEWTPDTVRIAALVDPLPFLKAGLWEQVHIGRLVSEERKKALEDEAAKAAAPAPEEAPAGSTSAGYMPPGAAAPMPMTADSSSSSAYMMSARPESAEFEHKDAAELMIRALDFTVDPDKTYRYRVRLVVFNPNRSREDVSPGVDTTTPELKGPWSEPTGEVTMPADVAAYAMGTVRGTAGRRAEQIQFQVSCWNPEDGVTVVKNFDAGPGAIIGEYASARVPTTDNSKEKTKTKPINFNSHQLLLDTYGGMGSLRSAGIAGPPLEIPAFSAMVRTDGTLLVRNQASDMHDEVRKDIESVYRQEIKDSGKKRRSSMGRRR